MTKSIFMNATMLLLLWVASVQAFAPMSNRIHTATSIHPQQHQQIRSIQKNAPHRRLLDSTTSTSISMSDGDSNSEFSRDVRLRAEAESPFRKLRFFLLAVLGGGATVSLLLSVLRIAAALNGVNTDLLDESLLNAGIDLAGVVVIALFYKRDLDAEESRLIRATKGAALASLPIRASNQLANGGLESTGGADAGTFTTTLAALRGGRGIEKRVVICAGGADKVKQILADAARLNDLLTANDLVIVPVVLPQGVAPTLSSDDSLPGSVALPMGNNWRTVIDDETREARKQGVDVEAEGISIILKKNGRVGQRTKGVFLGNMVGDVERRREMGLDVSNI